MKAKTILDAEKKAAIDIATELCSVMNVDAATVDYNSVEVLRSQQKEGL